MSSDLEPNNEVSPAFGPAPFEILEKVDRAAPGAVKERLLSTHSFRGRDGADHPTGRIPQPPMTVRPTTSTYCIRQNT